MKDKLRKELIKLKNNLSKSEVLEKSNLIKKRLFQMDEFKQASTILFYVSYDNEVNTHDMIKESMLNRKKVIVPVSDKEQKKLILSELKNWNDLSLCAYNILEPRKECIIEVPLDSIDLILVPGLGFDKHGHRIGHGLGYYDKLLESATDQSIGLAFHLQILDKIYVEKHDVSIHKIITDKEIIYCKN